MTALVRLQANIFGRSKGESALARLRLPWRWLLLMVPLSGMIVWAGLLSLTPSPIGLGTHLQLGLDPCPTLARTGQPCPTCGMTTAAAWLARGELQKAYLANPAALPLFGLAVISAAWALACSFGGRLVWFRTWDRPLESWAGGLFLTATTTWLIRVWQWRG